MTHNALVRFVAGKVGGTVVGDAISLGGLDACGQLLLHDLTSPELFLKGLEVLPDYISWDIDGDKSEQYVNLVDLRKGDTNVGRFWKTPEEIPLKFWEAYFELEEGAGVMEETP